MRYMRGCGLVAIHKLQRFFSLSTILNEMMKVDFQKLICLRMSYVSTVFLPFYRKKANLHTHTLNPIRHTMSAVL